MKLSSPADTNATTVLFRCDLVFQSPPQFEQGPITSEELDSAVKALKVGRAPGLDQVTAESLKMPELHEELLQLLNDVYLSGTVPPEWHLSALIPIPKKGDLSLRTNYRGIALMSIPAKLYNRVLLSRIRSALDSTSEATRTAFDHTGPPHSMCLHCDDSLRGVKKSKSTLLSLLLTSKRPLILSDGQPWTTYCQRMVSHQSCAVW